MNQQLTAPQNITDCSCSILNLKWLNISGVYYISENDTLIAYPFKVSFTLTIYYSNLNVKAIKMFAVL